VARDYLVLLRSRDLMVPSLAAGLAFFGVFAYVAGTPSVLIAARGLSQTTYGLIFGINALGMVVLSQFNRRWLTRHHPLRLLRVALRVQAAATALGLGLACFMPLPLPVLCVVLLCYIAPIGLVGGNSTVLAMAKHGQHAGKAAAVNGMVTMAVGGLGASLVGLLHDGTERPILLLMCLASLGAVALVHLLPPAADGAPADAN
jgi:DHA1 family bicyclomycin/chloramphenicol resistance-like MFS transporter